MKSERYHSLDGLRGLAALSVVLYHYVLAFAPFLLGYTVTRHTRFDHLIASTPLQLPLAGNFAVCIFFVLSGFVLSAKFFKSGKVEVLTSSATRRFFRLFIPAFASIMLAYLILRLGGFYAHQAGVLSQSGELQIHWAFPANIGHALSQGLYGTWFGHVNFRTDYNIVLWTMHYELFGSFLVFMLMALFGKTKNRWLFYSVFGVIFLKTYYLAFVAGMALCDLFTNRPDIKERLRPAWIWASLPVGIVLGTLTAKDAPYSSIYSHIRLASFTEAQMVVFAHVLGAIIVILAALRLAPLARWLSTRPMQYLGKISFGLYLTHFIILGSFASYLFTRIEPAYGYKVALITVPALGIGASLFFAALYTKWIDEPSLALSRGIGNYLLGSDIPKDIARQRRRLVKTLKLAKRPLPGIPAPDPLED